MHEYRRIERAFENVKPYEGHVMHHLRIAAWRRAEEEVLGPVEMCRLNIHMCPPGLAGPVEERAKVIYDQLFSALCRP